MSGGTDAEAVTTELREEKRREGKRRRHDITAFQRALPALAYLR